MSRAAGSSVADASDSPPDASLRLFLGGPALCGQALDERPVIDPLSSVIPSRLEIAIVLQYPRARKLKKSADFAECHDGVIAHQVSVSSDTDGRSN